MKKIYFFINGAHYTITGNWSWSLPVEELLCISMFVSMPVDDLYAGMLLAIIDPDFIDPLSEALSQDLKGRIEPLQFRIITSEGHAEMISLDFVESFGQNSSFKGLEKKEDEHHCCQTAMEKEHRLFSKNILSYQAAETLTSSGIWHMNLNTLETYYSDNVYRIYGIKPQSIAAGLTTFGEYIYTEDQQIVTDVFQQAFSLKIPLHLEFRISRPDGVQRWIEQITIWNFDDKGARILSGIIQDITERKNEEKNNEYEEEASHLKEKLLKIDEEMALLGHWQINLNTRQSSFSTQFHRIFGWKNGINELTLDEIIPFVHHEDQKKVQYGLDQLFRDVQPINLECRIMAADGKLRHVKWRSEVITTLNQDPTAIGVLQDITERKNMLAELQKTKATLESQTIFSNISNEISGIATWTWDETGIISCSESLYSLLGLKFSPRISREKLLEAVYPEDKNTFFEKTTAMFLNNTQSEFEFRTINRGQVKWLKAIFRCLVLENKKIFWATVQDISSAVNMQKELTSRIHYAESLSDNIIYRIITLDTEYRVLGWNRKCEEAYGQQKIDVLGSNIFDVLPPLKTPFVVESLKKVLQGEKVYLPQVAGFISEGWLEVSLTPLSDAQNKIIGILCLLHDTTENVKLQDQLKQRLSFIERLMEITMDRIIVLDRQMNYLFWNKKAEEYYGLTKEQVLSKNILEVFPSSGNGSHHDEIRKALKGKTVYISPGDGGQNAKYAETYIIPILDEKENEVTSVMCIEHDL
ncbi:MAG TPA: PAS domain S-box protein [Puia sp.]|nr:PAS domain S-box protein [Puia sp.]